MNARKEKRNRQSSRRLLLRIRLMSSRHDDNTSRLIKSAKRSDHLFQMTQSSGKTTFRHNGIEGCTKITKSRVRRRLCREFRLNCFQDLSLVATPQNFHIRSSFSPTRMWRRTMLLNRNIRMILQSTSHQNLIVSFINQSAAISYGTN